jgi:tetratricopeptide (TPR) repeat protein
LFGTGFVANIYKKSVADHCSERLKHVTLIMVFRVACLFGLLQCISGLCSVPDSALFSTAFERRVLLQYVNNDTADPVELFMALDYAEENEGIPSKINETLAGLQLRTAKLSLAKKLKVIYKTVQDDFLEKYTEDAHFNDIFENGNFNCVTASALYAIVLSRLNIPYIIKEMPDHVYLIADPYQTGFLIESTLPAKGVVAFDDRLKTSYIEFLHNNKIISLDDYMNKSVDELFALYYTPDKTVTLTELAGIQYYNKGAVLYNRSRYQESLKNFEKAGLLYDSDIIRYMKSNATTNILYEENQSRNYKGKTLAGYVNSNESNAMALQYARDFFNTVTNELVLNHPDIRAYDTYFHDFAGNIQIEDTADFYQTYYTYRGIYLYSNFDYFQALRYLEKAYRVNSENIHTRHLVSEITTKYLVSDNNYRTGIDSLSVYFSVFPFLKKEKVFQEYMVYCYARTANSSFEMNDAKQGNEILQSLESYLADNAGAVANERYIIYAYSGAALYYLKKQQYEQAEKKLRKGLSYAPDAEELKNMLKTTVQFHGDSYVYAETLPDNSGLKLYMNALTYARENSTAINTLAGMHLKGAWKMTGIVMNGQKARLSDEESLSFRLLENQKSTFTIDGIEEAGIWKYNEQTCILDLYNSADGESVHLIINEINALLLQGIMYGGTDYEEAAEVTFEPVK